MRVLLRLLLLCLTCLVSSAHAFDFAISNFKVVRNGTTIFDDTFAGTVPPAAPNFKSGAAASYNIPAGSFSAATGGKLHLNSAAATLSPAVSTKLAVAAQLITSKDAADLSSGLKPGMAIEVQGTWDATTPLGASEAYMIEIGDWTDLGSSGGKTCECIRAGVVKQSDGSVILRFWRDSVTNDAIQTRTVLGSVPFSPGANTQILLKLKAASTSPYAVTASYTFINGGVAGNETALAGTTNLFTARGYAVASFKASAPAAFATTQGTNSSLTMTASVNVANSHAGKTGNIYVAALWNGLVFFNNGTTWVPWTSGSFPAYMSNVVLGDRSVNVLSNLNVSGLTGAAVIVGYGQSDADLINSSAYETIYTVQ